MRSRPSAIDTAASGITNVPHTGSRAIRTPLGKRLGGAPRAPARMPSTRRQKARATKIASAMKRTRRSTSAARLRPRDAGMRSAQAVDGALGRLTLWTVGRELNDLTPRLHRTVEVLLAERFH